jgi:hypothetical protein
MLSATHRPHAISSIRYLILKSTAAPSIVESSACPILREVSSYTQQKLLPTVPLSLATAS